jgi:ABC-2 type transport system ATP-binding protein
MKTATAILNVSKLTKRFGTQEAVSALDFYAQRGEIVGLLGPNGAGKTTTIHMLLGLITADAGRIEIFAKDLRHARYEILERVNFSSAYVSLPGNLSVMENLNIFARLYGIADRQRRIAEVLAQLNLEGMKDKLAGILSSGQKTRLNLCKALLNKPDVLFLDEPTASLDPDVAERVRTVLKGLQREEKTTIIYTSHNMHEVEDLCDRVVFLSRGKVITQGTPAEIMRQAQSGSLEEVFIAIARNGELKDSDEEPD